MQESLQKYSSVKVAKNAYIQDGDFMWPGNVTQVIPNLTEEIWQKVLQMLPFSHKSPSFTEFGVAQEIW